MRHHQKTSLKTDPHWKRNALAHACFMVVAGISTTALAQVYTPGASLNVVNATLGAPGVLNDTTQTLGTYWSTGYNNQTRSLQTGSGQVDGIMGANNFYSTSSGAGSTPVAINNNSLLINSYGNQNPGVALSLANLANVSASNDGQLALNLQIFSGLAIEGAPDPEVPDSFGSKSVSATASNTTLYIEQTGKASAALSLSGNAVKATLALNTVDTSVTGATPSGYASATQGSSNVAYGNNNSAGTVAGVASVRGTTGSVNLSNLQTVFNGVGNAELSTATATITVSGTTPDTGAVGVLSDSINLNNNNLAASNTSNAAVSVFNATASSAAFTGSVAVTNIQTTKIDDVSAEQTAIVREGAVRADLRDNTNESKFSGTLNLNNNTVSAQVLGNSAGARTSTGSIAVGNAIQFDGSADIVGTTAPAAVAHSSQITGISTVANADLLINSVQRNDANTFQASLLPSQTTPVRYSEIVSRVDNLAGGSISQNGNTQSATATASLAGNLISAGSSTSIGNIQANAAILNTQSNVNTSVGASVESARQSVTVGIASPSATISGSVSLNDNSIQASTEGNVAVSSLNLKASNLTVGGNGSGLVALVPTTNSATSGLSASVLSLQSNDALDLTSDNKGSSITANFNEQTTAVNLPVSASQVSVNSNSLTALATANSASNALNLTASTASGLNAGLGNSQYLTGHDVTDGSETTFVPSTIAASAGVLGTPLSVAITAAGVSSSQLSLNSNELTAAAKGNTASNNITVNAVNASGLPVASGGLFATVKPISQASDANGVDGAKANADFALVNAQADNGTQLSASLFASNKITTTTVGTGSALSASSNQQSATGNVNFSSNALNLNIGNMNGMVAGVSSAQSASNSVSTVAATGEVSIAANSVVSGASSLVLNSNTISAASTANTVNNSLALTSTTASGRDLNVVISPANNLSKASIASGQATSTADFALVNQQQTSGASSDYAATTLANIKAATDNVTDSSVTLNANQSLASATANSANNSISWAATDLTLPNTGLSSLQALSTSDLTAKVNDSSSYGIGVVTLVAETAQIAVTNSIIRAAALGNVVSNSVAFTGTNITGSSVDFVAPTVSTSTAGSTVTVPASMALANLQTSSGNALSATLGISSGATAVTLTSGNVLDASALSLTGNTLASQVYNNDATNSLAMNATNINDITAALASGQSVSAVDLTARTDGLVKITAGTVSNSAVTASTNSVKSTVVGNMANNTLSLTATKITGQNVTVPEGGLAANATGKSANADYALVSEQSTVSSDLLSTTQGKVQVATLGTTSAAVSLSDNNLQAYTIANSATNALGLDAANLSAARAGLVSSQVFSADTGNSTVTSTLSSVDMGLLSTGAVSASQLSVLGNVAKATAAANLANNQISLDGTNATAGSVSLLASKSGIGDADAGLAMANRQVSDQGVIIANNGAASGGETTLGLTVGGVGTVAASTLTVSGNAVTALAYVNQSVQEMLLSPTNMLGMTAGLSSAQNAIDSSVAASTYGAVSLQAAGAVSAASGLSLNNNAVDAWAYRNSANNSMVVDSTTVSGSGRAVTTAQSLASSAALVKADFALNNNQLASGDSTTTATTVGTASLTASSTVTASNLNLNTNALGAYASGNAASNELGLTVTQLTQATGAIASFQSASKVSTAAPEVKAEVDGSVKLTASGLTSVSANVKDNTIKSTALGNVVSNTLALSGSVLTGKASVPDGVTSSATTTSATSAADFAISNVQLMDALVSSQTDGSVQIATGSLSSSALTLTGNTVKSLAQANSAVNDLSLRVTDQKDSTAAVTSSQSSLDNVTAITNPKASNVFGISASADVTNSTVVISGNTASAIAGKNEAFNSLTVTGANLTGRGNNVTASVAGTSSVSGADFAVINAQAAAGNTTATLMPGASGFETTGVLTGGSVSLSGNTVMAAANANTAGNTLSLTASNTLSASGVVNNVQSLADGAFSVTASIGVSSGTSGLTVNTGAGVGGAAVAVKDNVVKVSASANMASNVLNAVATNSIAAAGAVTSPGAGTATPTFAVLNQQTTGAGSSVSSAINQFNMGGSVLNGALNTGSLAMTGNQFQATAYGNSATNAVQVSALSAGLNSASASITNVQYNLASITATINQVNLQAGSSLNTGNSAGAGVNISGNSIVAMAVGNRAVNSTGR
ncbi:hypothetical protein B9Z38_11355 [Limnohabitans sp. MMS-10A-160]|uniref:hypothetical protein n=1 Tax=unclassified Limnohabitans TaxID=2626134 RepID=UPI000D39E256|nr:MULTISPECIES: hypothetical protein [unclassified Limnohabitans]PUE18882.1 hypothetical protein B9Z43_09375 [Limnohabitans sp. MMS-10A-192]PUE24512.1 hypothetical protein B9Z38_11355 [Limnohabitans sp. MMS-10A-160]